MKIGILTDIHENSEMLGRALKLAEKHKCDEMACLGDIVGFDLRFYRYNEQRSAKKTIEIIRSSCRWVVAGNHDLYAAGRLPSYSNGFEYPERWFEMSVSERKKISGGIVWCYEGDAPNDLGDNEIEYIKSLPEYIAVEAGQLGCLFSHYIYPDFTGSTTRYVERQKQLKDLWGFMHQKDTTVSFAGHSHNYFAGFGYKKSLSMFRAIHPIPSNFFHLGDEMTSVVLPPLSGEKGKTSFSIIDSEEKKLHIISTGTY